MPRDNALGYHRQGEHRHRRAKGRVKVHQPREQQSQSGTLSLRLRRRGFQTGPRTNGLTSVVSREFLQ